jgi:hypothetical protein
LKLRASASPDECDPRHPCDERYSRLPPLDRSLLSIVNSTGKLGIKREGWRLFGGSKWFETEGIT